MQPTSGEATLRSVVAYAVQLGAGGGGGGGEGGARTVCASLASIPTKHFFSPPSAYIFKMQSNVAAVSDRPSLGFPPSARSLDCATCMG